MRISKKLGTASGNDRCTFLLRLSESTKRRVMELTGRSMATVGNKGRARIDNTYDRAFVRLMDYLDAVGWEPLPYGYDTGWWLQDAGDDVRSAYEKETAKFEGKLGRRMDLGERVLFAQWHGYSLKDIVERPWLTGDGHGRVLENVEGRKVRGLGLAGHVDGTAVEGAGPGGAQ